MGKRSQFDADDLLYSCIFGKGIYQITGEMVDDPFTGDEAENRKSMVIYNILSGEAFIVKGVDCSPELREVYRKRIMNPPHRMHIQWPVDMIDLKPDSELGSTFVFQNYSDTQNKTEGHRCNTGLLFPYGDYPKMVNGIRKMKSVGRLSWEREEVRNFAYDILNAFDDINRSGYIYEDIHLSNFLFLDDGEIYFDFSGLVLPMREVYSKNTELSCVLNEDVYPIEFAEPAVFMGKQKTMDFQSQNYSLTALLFYLFMGRYPYDGRLLYGSSDEGFGTHSHYAKCRDAIRMPIFIFDPDDTSNKIGLYDEEQELIESWERLPDDMRSMFINTLRRSNAERTTMVDNPTPGMWMASFRANGWRKDESL